VAERIVDVLEPVEIEHEHGEFVGRDVVALPDRSLQHFGEEAAVRQPGQKIVLCEIGDLLLAARPIRDVLMRRQPAAIRHHMAADRHDPAIGEFLNLGALPGVLRHVYARIELEMGPFLPAQFEDLGQACAGHDLLCRQMIDFGVAAVQDHDPLVGIK